MHPRNPVTVHPIGGACLGASIADGVVGANGEVFDNPGLYVADASALPASPGGAPSLTIAAWSANVSPVTVQPLGGACLGTSVEDGVIDANGEIFDNPGLYVADAAALPTSPGRPPSLTIAAWAAHVADHLVAAIQHKDIDQVVEDEQR